LETDVGEREKVDVISEPNKKARVVIKYLEDPLLLESDGERQVVAYIKDYFESQPFYKIVSFRSRFDDPESGSMIGYFVEGIERLEGNDYNLLEQGVPLGDRFMSIERVNVIVGADQKLRQTASQVATSWDALAGRIEARDLVRREKEVQEYENRLAKEGKKVIINVSDDGSAWLVQVYEVVKQDEESHTATFNWYRVDKKTMEISREFENGQP